jgi:hypothetical protein
MAHATEESEIAVAFTLDLEHASALRTRDSSDVALMALEHGRW